MKKALLFLIAFILCMPAGAAQKVKVLLSWLPQSQFAGVYMAQKQGFYQRNGIEVKIDHADSNTRVIDELEAGKYDFIVCFCLPALMFAGNGGDIVNICQITGCSNIILVTGRQSGIKDKKDLEGKKLSTWDNNEAGLPVKLALAENGIKMRLYDQNPTNSLFLAGGVDVCSCMTYNEYLNLYYSGIDHKDMHTFRVADMGVDFPEDAVFCKSSTLNRRKSVCRAFVNATIEGWEYAAQHRDETLDEVVRRVNASHRRCSRIHMKNMLDTILQSVFSPDKKWQTGVLSRKQYRNCAELLKKNGFIKKIPEYSAFFRGF